jgi:3-oxoacyl-(acyl-carrier-protein) synthase
MYASPDRIVITATGIISSLGVGCAAHVQHILDQRSGLQHPSILNTVHAADFVVAEVPQSNAELLRVLSLEEDAPGFTRTALLAMVAMHDLMQQVPLSLLQQSRLSFINANTVGGMREVEHMYLKFLEEGNNEEYDKWIDTLDCGESTEHVARFFGLHPFMATISTACSSSANSLIVGARMLLHGLADMVVAGGGDALSRFTLNGFNSLKNIDRNPCRPFDSLRNGLNLGEGAGYLLMERETDALARGAHIIAILSGWSNANDAYHPTAPSPDGSGAVRTMQGALTMAGLSTADIGYINAHGTATLNNDIAEGKAIEQLWKGAPPPFSSTKPFTGHTLAAAGAIEAIISICCLGEGIIPPNLNFSTPMEELSIQPSVLSTGVSLRHVMSNSFGFGGNNVSLIFSKP